jgi:mannose-6-phosphate isomerase-like protein (cupin superfamily)
MGPAADQFTFEQDVTDGWCVLVPAGTWHDVTNTGNGPMRLYVIYAPVHHAAGKVQPTAADAEQRSGRRRSQRGDPGRGP